MGTCLFNKSRKVSSNEDGLYHLRYLVQAAGANLALGFNYSIYVMVGLFLLIAILNLLIVRPDNNKETTVSEEMTA
ncbi:hypothetical protein [Neobacillus niacini]|uniref:hypothetical protein n=1 Tax=Neobacillus niacini TaxID=86668 RepID=UPI0005EF351C|nr:hypothetical protein [Neobacillus niacini]